MAFFDITDVKGIGLSSAANLASQGILTVEDLAEISVDRLILTPGFSELRAANVIDEARAMLAAQMESDGQAAENLSEQAETAKEAVTEPSKKKKKKVKEKKKRKAKDKKSAVKSKKKKKEKKKGKSTR